MITPYTIAIPQANLDDLKTRLAHTRWTNEIPGTGTAYGVDLLSVKRLVKYWQEGYDWRIREVKLNAYPQFTTTIDGQNIHFLHIRSKVDNALPLLLTHGWPSSVVDYLDLIGPSPIPTPMATRRLRPFTWSFHRFLASGSLDLPPREAGIATASPTPGLS